ncbi:LysR family transcriptional regulator [Pseudomonas nicosulfuronedens]|uniref:LysR family transcriptional regulator n=1 Tax=Pseudomonas nicosulfuronedens TaxID=2571105 RepID=A0A5R9QWK6_9PSED|nr:LysR family transcriptional regulator [Pseudomonas nicosulfuronedens]MDH1011972.1 LysR family transcriptional regulator [Pseudomonas nicosulfuronedens]MDH1981383.1 LysR family transcriptional regulator [Pseudomonas nicosulfuronedens]MDH2029503.1 LysR family transcriptional regulator [Pseudomonas nicosulfuronedens]TLX74529.1 LysR family transcriptional regulator [Pseudomonas nicosulfuronedens]
MDWDNLRFFLELSRAGKLTVAARRLGVDHTTVARRLQALEKSIGAQLLVREPAGYRLTEAGHGLLPQAEAMESACKVIEKRLAGTEDNLSGKVRIGATEGYGSTLLTSQLVELNQRHPHLGVDLLAVPRALQLSRHEADIVITLERPGRGPYIITRLTDYVLRLYASKDYLAERGPIGTRDDLRDHALVGYVDDLLYSKELQYLDEIGRPLHMALRCTSILAQQRAVAEGAGLAILPAFAAAEDSSLQPILAGEIEFVRTFWMLMPTELKDIARMRTTWDFLREKAEGSQDVLMGRSA